MEDSLMDIKQTAKYLKMNKMTVYKLAREGKIPAFKISSEWRFKKELIDQWLMSQVKDKTILSQHYKTAKPKPTILIIDDEKAIREYFVKALADYQVLTASSGEEGLALIEKTRPDVVLLDLRMPGLSGIDTLKRIKAFDKSIPVIILSAFADLETSIEAARLGAFTSIAKPFDLEEMKKVLEAARQK